MAAHQAPPSLGFSRQEHWSGLPFPSPMHESEKWKWSHSVVSDSSRLHGLQPTRFLRPWDFPGKSTGVGCHCLLRVGRLHLWKPILLSCPLSFSTSHVSSPLAIKVAFIFWDHDWHASILHSGVKKKVTFSLVFNLSLYLFKVEIQKSVSNSPSRFFYGAA